MMGKTIYIAYDENEERTAKALCTFLSTVYKGKVSSTLVSEPVIPDEDNTAEKLALILCSPYSLSQTNIHAICGAFHAFNSVQIIPVCFSGVKPDQLPPYFSSNQGVYVKPRNHSYKPRDKREKEKEKFIENLGKSESAIKKAICHHLKVGCENNNTGALYNQLKADHSSGVDIKPEDTPGTSGNCEYPWFTLNRRSCDLDVECVDDEKVGQTQIEEVIPAMVHFLRTKDRAQLNCRLAAGVVPLLVDNDMVYVGVKKEQTGTYLSGTPRTAQARLYHSGTSGTAIDPRSNTESLDGLLDHWDLDQNDWGGDNERVSEYLSNRLASMNHPLFEIKINEAHCLATLIINDSDDCPRFDLCIFTVIRVEELENKQDAYLHKLGGDWVWAKDGVIHYWWFNSPGAIPKNSNVENADSYFLSSQELYLYYGQCRVLTPYTSDELSSVAKRKDLFTISARTLLTIF